MADVVTAAVLIVLAGLCAAWAWRARWPSARARLEHLEFMREEYPGVQWTLQDVDRYFASSWLPWTVLTVLFATLAAVVVV